MSAALEHLAASTYQTDTRIGWIFWFNVSEKPEDQNIVRAAFFQSGLPDKYNLPRIRAVDAYRRATTSIEGRATVQDHSKIELMVRGDEADKAGVTRKIVIEDHNRSTRELNYHPKAAILRFNRDYEMVDADVYKSEPFILDAVQKFKENYELFLKTYDGQAKRRVARSVLSDLAATSVKDTGGVYLIPRPNEELMFQLVSYIKELPGCNAQKVPVVDTSETSDMMRDVVTQKAESSLRQASRRAWRIGQTRACTVRFYVTNASYELVQFERMMKRRMAAVLLEGRIDKSSLASFGQRDALSASTFDIAACLGDVNDLSERWKSIADRDIPQGVLMLPEDEFATEIGQAMKRLASETRRAAGVSEPIEVVKPVPMVAAAFHTETTPSAPFSLFDIAIDNVENTAKDGVAYENVTVLTVGDLRRQQMGMVTKAQRASKRNQTDDNQTVLFAL